LVEGRGFSETRSRMWNEGKIKFVKDMEFQNWSRNLDTRFPVGKVKDVVVPPSFLNTAEDPLVASEAKMYKSRRANPDEPLLRRGEDKMKREVQGQRMMKAKISRQSYRELEKAKLSNGEMEELVQLMKELGQLRQRVKILEADKAKCVREHGTQEVKELRPIVKKCKEELSNEQQSASNCSVKQEEEGREFSCNCIKREGLETGNFGDEIKSEGEGTEYFEKTSSKEIELTM